MCVWALETIMGTSVAEPKCSNNMTYMLCGPDPNNPTQPERTCLHVREPDLGLPDKVVGCQEGCYCQTGLVREGDRCTSPGKCGCNYGGLYIPVGSSLLTCLLSCYCCRWLSQRHVTSINVVFGGYRIWSLQAVNSLYWYKEGYSHCTMVAVLHLSITIISFLPLSLYPNLQTLSLVLSSLIHTKWTRNQRWMGSLSFLPDCILKKKKLLIS